MKKVVIIDDEPLARSLVREYLGKQAEKFEVAAECNDGFEGIKAILKYKPDLVFLDIQMPRISGLEMLEALENPPDVIFATAFDEFAISAFERNAVDYLLKPFSQERFNEALGRWLIRRGNPHPVNRMLNDPANAARDPGRIVVRSGADILIVPVNDVVYIEAYDDYVKIFTERSYYLKKKTMAYYEQTTDPLLFLRVHRSYMINLRFLLRIEPLKKDSYVAVMKDGKKIPLSRAGYARLRERLE